jgi:hypothetical protein
MEMSLAKMNPLPPALKILTATLERLGIRYLVGGSLASSAHGVYRATADADLLVELDAGSALRLAEDLGKSWYADPDLIRQSIRPGRAFNLMYIPRAEKFGLFPALDDFHFSELERAGMTELDIAGFRIRCPVASAEDILLAKLQWYRAGGEVSEAQWKYLAGIVAANPRIDRSYLAKWAAPLGVDDLLTRALGESQQ